MQQIYISARSLNILHLRFSELPFKQNETYEIFTLKILCEKGTVSMRFYGSIVAN